MKVRKLTVCHTCRTRKLGCDGKRPSCSQCVGTKIKCGGYEYDLIFVQSNLSLPGPSKARKPKKDAKAKKRVENRQQQTIIINSAIQLTPEEFALDRSRRVVIPTSLAWPMQDIISLVVQNFSPLGYPRSGSARDPDNFPRICGGWIELLPNLSSNGCHGEALAAAIKTLGVTILSKGCNGIAPTSDALAAHCSALQSLHDSLPHVGADDSNVLAAAIMCLLMSEVIIPTVNIQGTAGTTHAAGLSDLMQFHSPEYYSTGAAHRLFLGFRPAMLIHAIRNRIPTFLAKDEWKTIPFQFDKPNSFHALMNVATAIPAILADMKALEEQASASVEPRKVLIALDNLLDSLAEWNRSFQSLASQPSFRVIGKTTETARIWFPNITVANAMTHYWAFWILSVAYIRQLRADYPVLLDELIYVNGESPESPLVTEIAAQMARWSLQSVGYLLQDEMKLFGAISSTLPVRVAYHYFRPSFPHDQVTAQWCESVVDWIRKSGYEFIAHFIVEADGP